MPLPYKINDLIEALDLIPHPEGGFFVETFRSGCEPMSTMGQTGLVDSEKGCAVPKKCLVVADGRASKRPDGDERRNCLTSIYWVPTAEKSSRLLLAKNLSDHVHYYQGGLPFRYYLFNPETNEFSSVVLGPELHKGHKMQVCVEGGIWKCGQILDSDEIKDVSLLDYEYSLIGEAVAPGFDFHDFAWVTKEEVLQKKISCKDNEERTQLFLSFVHSEATVITNENKTVDEASKFYEDDDTKARRVEERAGK